MLNRLPTAFINHIELWLSGAGLVVIFGVSLLAGSSDREFWQLMAIVAVGVGILHGFIFWIVRRRQRQIRRQSIREIRAMLADIVKNKLAVIEMYLTETEEQELEEIRSAIEDIAEEVESLSEESLEGWKDQYDQAIRRTTDLEPS